MLTTQQLEIYETTEYYKGPVKIIHGSNDKLVPLWCSEDYKALYGEKADLVVIDGENHRITRKLKDVTELVVTFFKEKAND